jgi:16S rRNA (guanine(966)-N(2))-methyltransferase RsmD
MKILTGSLKGQRIAFRPAMGLRPTSDKVRKAIFDILRERVEGAVVLDLFSGTGALGLEALSLGAAKAVFVEEDRARYHEIEENIGRLGLAERGFALAGAVAAIIDRLSRYADKFDIIFMDPPYKTGFALETLKIISQSQIFHRQTLLVVEIGSREDLPEQIGTFQNIKKKTHGDTQVLIYAVAHD